MTIIQQIQQKSSSNSLKGYTAIKKLTVGLESEPLMAMNNDIQLPFKDFKYQKGSLGVKIMLLAYAFTVSIGLGMLLEMIKRRKF